MLYYECHVTRFLLDGSFFWNRAHPTLVAFFERGVDDVAQATTTGDTRTDVHRSHQSQLERLRYRHSDVDPHVSLSALSAEAVLSAKRGDTRLEFFTRVVDACERASPMEVERVLATPDDRWRRLVAAVEEASAGLPPHVRLAFALMKHWYDMLRIYERRSVVRCVNASCGRWLPAYIRGDGGGVEDSLAATFDSYCERAQLRTEEDDEAPASDLYLQKHASDFRLVDACRGRELTCTGMEEYWLRCGLRPSSLLALDPPEQERCGRRCCSATCEQLYASEAARLWARLCRPLVTRSLRSHRSGGSSVRPQHSAHDFACALLDTTLRCNSSLRAKVDRALSDTSYRRLSTSTRCNFVSSVVRAANVDVGVVYAAQLPGRRSEHRLRPKRRATWRGELAFHELASDVLEVYKHSTCHQCDRRSSMVTTVLPRSAFLEALRANDGRI